MINKHNVFISYHHDHDEYYKNMLIKLNKQNEIFIDKSVDTNDIDENLPDETIRNKIRDEYLRDSTVTILLLGTETKNRKHIDWEIFSSMYNGVKNKKSGIVVINLPSIENSSLIYAAHENEKRYIFSEIPSSGWFDIKTREICEMKYPYMLDRINDNILKEDVKISVVSWSNLNSAKLRILIENAHKDRFSFEYDMSRKMKRKNS